MWAIEIKLGLAPKLKRGFHHARVDLDPDRCFVDCSGHERYSIGKGIEAIGVTELGMPLSEKQSSALGRLTRQARRRARDIRDLYEQLG